MNRLFVSWRAKGLVGPVIGGACMIDGGGGGRLDAGIVAWAMGGGGRGEA